MEKLKISGRLKKYAGTKTKKMVVHQVQDGENWCWAASALMMNPSQATSQLALVYSFLFPPGGAPLRNCSHSDCATQLVMTKPGRADYPLCLQCNHQLLNDKISVPYTKTGVLKFRELAVKLQSRPVEAYVRVGTHAHFLVIFDSFLLPLSTGEHQFLALADPYRYGPGFCDYTVFKKCGGYQSRSAVARAWEWSFY